MTNQRTLFGDGQKEHEADLNAKAVAAGRVQETLSKIKDPEQEQQLARVYKGLKAALIAFRLNVGKDKEFTCDYLNEQLKLAGHEFRPDSPRRILNELKRDGAIDYVVVNRGQGLWMFTK